MLGPRELSNSPKARRESKESFLNVEHYEVLVSSSPPNSSVRQTDISLMMKIIKGLTHQPEAKEGTEGLQCDSKSYFQVGFFPTASCVMSLEVSCWDWRIQSSLRMKSWFMKMKLR